MMLTKTKSGNHTPLSNRASQEQYITPQELQKSLGQALESRLNPGGTLRPQAPSAGSHSVQRQPQYQPSPAAVMMGLAPGVRPVPSPMAASAKRPAAPAQGVSQVNSGAGGISSGMLEATATAHPSDRKDLSTRLVVSRSAFLILLFRAGTMALLRIIKIICPQST